MGIYRRKRSKLYWMTFRIRGRRIFKSTGTTNKQLAERIYARIVTEIHEGKWFPNEANKRKFEELRDRYMKDHSSPNKTLKSSLRDETSFKHLSKIFHGLTMAEITPSRISEYKSLRRGEGAKPATLSRELEVLRHALNLAVREWEWLDKSPFEKVKLDRVNNKVERWITREEEERLLNASLPWLRQIILFALHTGMRQEEILSLLWNQVDLVRRTLTLFHTKNKEKRTIPLNETVMTLLKAKSRVHSISGFIFTSQAETRIDARNLLRAFYAARKKAGLDDVRFHDLRHTFATRLVQAGVNLYVVKELLGHKTLAMTLRYAHHYPESLRHGVAVLDAPGDTLVTLGRNTVTDTSVKPLCAEPLQGVIHV